MEILVFGGTAEGRRLVEWLDARGSCNVVACTVTDYGASLLPHGSHVTALQGPLSDDAKRRLMEGHDFVCIVDATHPFARHISQSVVQLAASYGKEVVRVVRESSEEGAWTRMSDAAAAARYLATTTGNVLLTTGAKDIDVYTDALPDFAQRLYVRILPLEASLERALELGIAPSHIIAMQGPFSTELNQALVREFAIEHLVTKESGTAGGFDEKVRAAQACGIELVAIERPQEEGLPIEAVQTLLEERYGL